MGDGLALSAGGLAAAGVAYLLFIEGSSGLPVFAVAGAGLFVAWIFAEE